jgi:hypothetical protein
MAWGGNLSVALITIDECNGGGQDFQARIERISSLTASQRRAEIFNEPVRATT